MYYRPMSEDSYDQAAYTTLNELVLKTSLHMCTLLHKHYIIHNNRYKGVALKVDLFNTVQ